MPCKDAPRCNATESLWKRLIDVVGASFLLVAASPIMAMAAVGTWATLGGPILFRQWRSGLAGRPFLLTKFRTMHPTTTAGTDGSEHDITRLSRFGRILRSSSIDELPTLLNVLKGEMSLVGPRPLLTQYRKRYSPKQARRLEVLPGVTGWAQVHGRNSLPWEAKFDLDVWYVDNWSVALDAKILTSTIGRVFARDGVDADNGATMPEFIDPP